MNRPIFGLLGFALIALIACGGGGSNAPAAEVLPDGFERRVHESGLFSIAFPSDWVETKDSLERSRRIGSDGFEDAINRTNINPLSPDNLTSLFLVEGMARPIRLDVEAGRKSDTGASEWTDLILDGFKELSVEYELVSSQSKKINNRSARISEFTHRLAGDDSPTWLVLSAIDDGDRRWIIGCGVEDMVADYLDSDPALCRSIINSFQVL